MNYKAVTTHVPNISLSEKRGNGQHFHRPALCNQPARGNPTESTRDKSVCNNANYGLEANYNLQVQLPPQ